MRSGRPAAPVGWRADAQRPAAIDSGQPLGQPAPLPGAEQVDADTDRDGLTDAFERLAGTKVTDADSDADGLSDGYEALKSRTDPLAKDTDSDGLTDAQEVATGGDAGTIPGVAGVVGAGALAENVRDGVEDADSDGLSDRVEKLVGTDATKADTDGDKLTDAMEIAFGTKPAAGRHRPRRDIGCGRGAVRGGPAGPRIGHGADCPGWATRGRPAGGPVRRLR